MKRKYLSGLFVLILIAFMLTACGSSGGDGDGDGNGGITPTTTVGTWDLIQDMDGNAMPSGSLTLIMTNTTYSVSTPGCEMIGTYTINGTSMTLTVVAVDGCGDDPGDITVVQFTVNSTNLTTTDDDGTMIFKKIGSGGDPALVGTWELTDFKADDIPAEQVLSELITMVFTGSTYTYTVEGDCEVSGIATFDGSSIVIASTSRTGNTDTYCDYHEQPHSVSYTVTSTTFIVTEGDVVMTFTRQ